MFGGRAAFVVVVVVCFLQVIHGIPKNDTVDLSNNLLEEALKEAKAVVQRVEQQIQSVIQQVQTQVRNSLDQIKRFGSNLTSQAKSKVKEFYTQIHNTVEDAKDIAQKAGIDISECISKVSEAKSVLSNKSKGLDSCVLNEADEFHKLENISQKATEDAETFVNHAREALSQCVAAPLTAVQCLADHTTETINDAIRVVTDLGQAGQTVRQEVTNEVVKIGSCVQDNIVKMKSEAQRIVNDFSTCFASKQKKL